MNFEKLEIIKGFICFLLITIQSLIIYLWKALNIFKDFIDKTILSDGYDDYLLAVFVGFSAYIISLSIFIFENKNKNRETHLPFLVEQSGIVKLIKYSLITFLLMIVSLYYDHILIKYLITMLVVTINIMLLCYFKNFISTFLSEDKSNREFKKFLEKRKDNFEKNINDIKSKYPNFEKELAKCDFISYDELHGFFEDKDEYTDIYSKETGYIDNIDFKYISKLVKKNKDNEYDTNSSHINDAYNKQQKNSKKLFILKKVLGSSIKEGESILRVKKNLNIEENKILNSIRIKAVNVDDRNMVERDINNIFSDLLNSYKENNEFDSDKYQKEIVQFFKAFIETNDTDFLDKIFHHMRNIRFNYKNFEKQILKFSLLLSSEAKNKNNFNEFKKYYSMYFYLRLSDLKTNLEFEKLINDLSFYEKITAGNFGEINVSYYFLNLKQQIIFDAIGKEKYSVITSVFPQNSSRIYSVNGSLFATNRIKDSELYDGDEDYKESFILNSKKAYIKSMEYLIPENIVKIGAISWLIYKFNKANSENAENIRKVIVKTIHNWFLGYNVADILELNFELNKEEKYNELVSSWHFLEFKEPENMHQGLITIQFDEISSLILIAYYNGIRIEQNKLELLNIVNKKNEYLFRTFIDRLKKYDYFAESILKYPPDKKDAYKNDLINYLNLKLEKCIEEKKNEILNSSLSNDVIDKFRKEINYLLDNRNDKISNFLFDEKKWIINETPVKESKGFNQFIDKDYFIEEPEKSVKFMAKEYANAIIEAENELFLTELYKKSIEIIEDSLDEIIETFPDKSEIVILVPYYYISNKIEYYDKEEKYVYYYKKEKVKIPVIEGFYFEDNCAIILSKKSIEGIYKNKLEEDSYGDLNSEGTRQISLIDVSYNTKMVKELKVNPPEFLSKDNDDIDEYLKEHLIIKIFESINIKISEKFPIYRYPIE